MPRRTADGYIDPDDEVAVDGEVVKVRFELMDGVQRQIAGWTFDGHRPGYLALTDEQIAARQEARDAMIDRATSAWRSPERSAGASSGEAADEGLRGTA